MAAAAVVVMMVMPRVHRLLCHGDYAVTKRREHYKTRVYETASGCLNAVSLYEVHVDLTSTVCRPLREREMATPLYEIFSAFRVL